jgi:glycosidase
MNRFLWITGGDRRRLKIAALCQFALAGQPVIYYGTEVGLSQHRDVRQDQFGIMEEARLPMIWDERQDAGLLAFYKQLIRLRSTHGSLRSGARRILYADADVLAFEREKQAPGVAAVFNLASEARRVTLEGDWQELLLATDPACDLKTVSGQAMVELPPLSGVYMK